MIFKARMGWMGRRFWESRQFYSAYIALFVAITNWITIQYKLLLENIPVLNIVFSNIWIFMIVAVVIFTTISILGGHYIHRKRQFRIEQAVATEENPYLYLALPGRKENYFYLLPSCNSKLWRSSCNLVTCCPKKRGKLSEKYKNGLAGLIQGVPYTKMWS